MGNFRFMNEVICGNALTELLKLEPNSIDLVITSPPYFGQREYKSGSQEIGLEKNVERYLNKLSMVFRLCLRVCKPDGNIVFNMGDKYIGGSLQLIPYQFALMVLRRNNDVKLINEITWIKSNPTPRQYNRRLVPATEPFFHFVKSDKYYYNRKEFSASSEPIKPNKSPKKGMRYDKMISASNLVIKEKFRAKLALRRTLSELREGKISDFRMKIRGMHKKAFGGQAGGRNSQIEKQGYTIIKMYGNKIKRDVITSPVARAKNIDHPSIFPLQIVKELVLLLSKVGSVILDPFCGSGQVCFMAKSLNRRYLGIDLNPRYCQMAEKRLSDLPEK